MSRTSILALGLLLAVACSSPDENSAIVAIRGAVSGPSFFLDQQGAVARIALVPDLHGSLLTSVSVSVADVEGRITSSAPTVVSDGRLGDVTTTRGSETIVTFTPPVSDGTVVTLVVTAPDRAPAPWRCLIVPSVKSPNAP